MAPGQARGEGTDVRADIYALGLVLRGALTGGETALGGIDPHMEVVVELADETRRRVGGRTERHHVGFLHREAELLFDLARGRGSGSFIRLDETGGQLPDVRRHRIAWTQGERGADGRSQEDVDTAVDHVMGGHDRCVDRGAVEDVVRKSSAARSIVTARDEIHPPHLQEPTPVRVGSAVGDHLELDLRGIGEELQGRGYYGMKVSFSRVIVGRVVRPLPASSLLRCKRSQRGNFVTGSTS